MPRGGDDVARYRTIRIALWSEPWFRRITDAAARLYLYLLSGERTIAAPGVVLAGLGAMSDDLGRTPTELEATLAELAAIEVHGPGGGRAVVAADQAARLVILPHELRYASPPSNANVGKAWAANLEAVPPCELRTYVIRALAPLCEPLAQRFPEAFPHALPDDPGSDPEPVPVPDSLRGRALALWAVFNAGRAELGLRKLTPTDDRIARVQRLLSHGRTDDEVRTVIAHYVGNAKRDAQHVQWCNGDTPFRPANFDRALDFAAAAAGGTKRTLRAVGGRYEPEE